MTTNFAVILILLAILVIIGGLSVAHRMRERADHGRDRQTPAGRPDDRPDL
jgi:hypothetical protein